MYRTIDTAMWHDPTFRSLPAPGKLLFIYLITNPHAHLSGIYYLPNVMILHESGVKAEAIDTLWDTLSRSGLAYRDKELEVVWVRNMLRYQGKGEKHERSAANQLATLHNCGLIKDFLKLYPNVKRYFRHGVSDRASRFGTQEQEKDQEQEIPPAPQGGGAPDGAPDKTPEGFLRWWNAYPAGLRKVGRTKCLRDWKRRKLEPVAEQVIVALESAKASAQWRKNGGEYVPKPQSWLNDSPWETAPADRVPQSNGAPLEPLTAARVHDI